MNTKDDALKLALEALEWLTAAEPGNEPPISDAITAIREVLAEQPAPPPECKTDAEKTAFAFGWWKALEENRKQPAQQQEPVAWRYTTASGAYRYCKHRPNIDMATEYAILEPIPLYTSPPASKPWVGLTDKEFQWIYDNGRTPAGMIEMAEAKLREKNV